MSQEIQHEGVVIHTDHNEAKVRIQQTSACSACHAHNRCMAAESTEKIIDCQMEEPLSAGDHVIVTVARKVGFTAVLLAFVLPFAILTSMIWLLDIYISNEGIAGTLALCSLVPYYLLLAILRKRIKKRFSFSARKITTEQNNNNNSNTQV